MNTLTEQEAIQLLLSKTSVNLTRHPVIFFDGTQSICDALEVNDQGDLVVRLTAGRSSFSSKPLHVAVFIQDLKNIGLKPILTDRRSAYAEAYKTGCTERVVGMDVSKVACHLPADVLRLIGPCVLDNR